MSKIQWCKLSLTNLWILKLQMNKIMWCDYKCLQCSDTVGWVLVGCQEGHPACKNWVMSCCHYIPKPHHLSPHLNPDWFYLSGTGLSCSFSALTLLDGWQEGHRPVKNWVVGCWRGYLSGARCRLAYGPADATVSCSSKIQIGFTFLVPAHTGNPGQRAVKRVCTGLSRLSWKRSR